MLKDGFFQLFDTTFKRVEEIKFDKNDNVDNTLMSLYATVIEQTASAIFLIKNEYYGGVEAILRSVMEAYIDIINLDVDPRYINQMLLEFYHSQAKVGKQAAKGNKWLAEMNTDEVAKKNEEWQGKYDRLLATDKPHLDKLGRFKRAGEEETYRAVYKTLCDDAHNNITALTNRHMRPGMDGSDFELVIFAQPDETHLAMMCDIFAGILNHANHIMHGHYHCPALDDIKVAGQKMEEVRDAYIASRHS